jgi:hypothetical protein
LEYLKRILRFGLKEPFSEHESWMMMMNYLRGEQHLFNIFGELLDKTLLDE